MKLTEPIRLVGIDLGQQRDYTAISVTERVLSRTGVLSQEVTYDHHRGHRGLEVREKVITDYHVRHLERPALGTPYPEVADRVVALLKALGGSPVLVVDTTGVGRPVVDMLKEKLIEGLEGTNIRVTPCWVSITGGNAVTRKPDSGFLNVPKSDLISAALVLMQNGQLKIAESLALREALVKELLNFRVKINIATAHDSYEAWREGDHDDLVLSVALACWAGERFLKKVDSVPAEPEASRS